MSDEAQRLLNTNIGDKSWRDQVSTMDEATLRMLAAHLRSQRRTFAARAQFIDVLLSLLPEHQCTCDKRWTSGDVPHDKDCERLKACTCERQWIGNGLYVTDHDPDCAIRKWVMVTPVIPTPEGEINE